MKEKQNEGTPIRVDHLLTRTYLSRLPQLFLVFPQNWKFSKIISYKHLSLDNDLVMDFPLVFVPSREGSILKLKNVNGPLSKKILQ